MRALAGILVLMGGIAGLAVWGATHQARGIEERIDTEAQRLVSKAPHQMEVAVSGRDITVTGVAIQEEERATLLSALDKIQGVRRIHDAIDRIDTARPYLFLATRKGGVTTVNGHLPDERLRGHIKNTGVDGSETLAIARGAPENWVIAATSGIKALNRLENGLLRIQDTRIHLTGTASAPDQRRNALDHLATLPGTFAILTRVDMRDDATLRHNPATGNADQFLNGYGLAQPDVTPDLASCTRQSDALLKANRITFVSGSAQLEPRAIDTVNQLAAIVSRCVDGTGFTAEIGGHTDNTGSQAINQAISLDRAQSVKQALESRGIPGEALDAVGYGQRQPVADNDSEAGRAANRRTSITWSDRK